jgi:hypothetical protein
MKKVFVVILMVLSLGLANVALVPTGQVAAACDEFLGFPSWCRNLDLDADGNVVSPCADSSDGSCGSGPSINKFVWTIVLNISDILFRLAGMIAVGFVMYAGFTYLISQGQSDKIGNAKKMLQNALIGLVIAILATAIINTVMGVIAA